MLRDLNRHLRRSRLCLLVFSLTLYRDWGETIACQSEAEADPRRTIMTMRDVPSDRLPECGSGTEKSRKWFLNFFPVVPFSEGLASAVDRRFG